MGLFRGFSGRAGETSGDSSHHLIRAKLGDAVPVGTKAPALHAGMGYGERQRPRSRQLDHAVGPMIIASNFGLSDAEPQ